MRPILVISFPESWSGKLGGTDLLFSVKPKCYKRDTESLHCNLSGTDRSLRLDQNVTKGNREFTLQSWWDRIGKLGQTDSVNLVTVRIFSGTDMQLGRTDMVRVRA